MRTGATARAILLGSGLATADAVPLAAFCAGRLDGPAALAAHLVLCLAVVLGAWSTRCRGARLQLSAWTALLGPFGALIGATLFLPNAGGGIDADHGTGAASPDRITTGDDDDAMPGPLETLHNAVLDSRLRLGGGCAVRPLLDLVIEGTIGEKLDALSLIARHYIPALAPALKRALQDADVSVRVLAATVMAQLHNAHTHRIGALQDAARAAPTEAGWRSLGEARLAYAMSGLLDPDRAKREADEGRACLARAGMVGESEPSRPPARPEGAANTAPEAVRHVA